MRDFLEIARTLGFTEAVLRSDLSLTSRAESRAYCNPEQCPNHGQNWVCPPGCGTLEECAERVREFSEGILLQSVTELIPPTELETYKALNRAHNARLKELIEAVKPVVDKLLPLTTGGCSFCVECSYPEPCLRPDVKMESLSAFGIDVGELCEKAGLDYSFRKDRVYFTALLLFVRVNQDDRIIT